MSDRSVILGKLRQALEKFPAPCEALEGDTPRAAGPMSFADAPWDRIRAEWDDLGVGVYMAAGRDEARAALAEVIDRAGKGPVVRWDCPVLNDLALNDLLGEAEAAQADGEGRYADLAASAALGITGADCLIAETGTVVVLAEPGRERSASLLPPRHLAVITPETTIVPDVPALGPWLETLAARPQGMPSAVHCITGPSATADIELIKIVGIHGPMVMDVLVIMPEA